MSDHEEKNVNQPEDEQFDFSSMSIDELIASTKEEIARVDEMMGTSRLPDAEEAAEELKTILRAESLKTSNRKKFIDEVLRYDA